MLEADSVVSSDADLGMQGEVVLVWAQSACSLVETVGVLRLLDQELDRLAGQRSTCTRMPQHVSSRLVAVRVLGQDGVLSGDPD